MSVPASASTSNPGAPDTDTSSSSSSPPKKTIRTYHCAFCSHLLLASTRPVSATSLPRRGAPARDRALILPLPPPSTTTTAAASERARKEPDWKETGIGMEASSGTREKKKKTLEEGTAGQQQQQQQEEGEQDQRKAKELSTNEDEEEEPDQADQSEQDEQEPDCTILLSTTLADRTDTIIRRADGLERRTLLRCGRCRVVMGYTITSDDSGNEVDKLGAENGGKGEDGGTDGECRGKIVYVLPGAVVESGQMGAVPDSKEWEDWVQAGGQTT